MNPHRSISVQGFRIRTSNERYIMFKKSKKSKKSKTPKLPKLQCFSEDPHLSHEWVFYYNEPPSVHICPGVPDEDDG